MRFEINIVGYRGHITIKPFSFGTWIDWKNVVSKGCDLYESEADNNLVTTVWAVCNLIDEWKLEKQVQDEWVDVPRMNVGDSPYGFDFKITNWLRNEPAQHIMQEVSTDTKK